MPMRRELVPPAKSFYEGELGQLDPANAKGWARVKAGCFSHDSRSKASFFINVRNGSFVCFGCAIKGDIIKFVMLRHNCDFKTACKRLHCWQEENGKPASRKWAKAGPLVQMLVMDMIVDGTQYSVSVQDEPKGELESLRRLYHEAADRLSEIQAGGAEQFEGEEETQWGILAASWELIQMELADVRH